ncbi:MAG: hypothetical protein IJV33_06030 [Bacteroidaceae bacterium]|nr:hypothetical protein [Bacteroidaceae bacterium]
MSTAERTARNFYYAHHLATMPEDVKRHLMILLLSTPDDEKSYSYLEADDEESNSILAEPAPQPFTMEDIHRRLEQSVADAKAGRTMTCETVHANMETQFPWLCE